MKVQDIHTTDVSLWGQYVQAFANGQYDQAAAILQSAQLQTKAMKAGVLNEAADNLLALEQLYYSNVEDTLADDLTAFNQMIAQFVTKQAYNAAIVYTKGNFVTYDNAVYVYINDVAASGHVPTDTAYWLYLGLRGKDGDAGLDLRLKYNWQQNVQYNRYDVVVYKNAMWYANEANVNIAPDAAGTTWGLLFQIPIAKIFTSRQQPDSRYAGLLWWMQKAPYTFAEVDAMGLTFDDLPSKNLIWQVVDYGGW